MKELLNSFSVKKFIAVTLTLVFIYLSVRQFLDSQKFMEVYMFIVGTYFGHSIGKEYNTDEVIKKSV